MRATLTRGLSGFAGIALLTSTSVAAVSLISVNDEISLGRQAQQQVQAEVPVVYDQAVSGYVSSVGRRLASHAGGPQYPYTFSTANYREINAFALPGGPVWIHRGAMEAAQNEAQLAGVLAHEVAHISQRHAADQITKGIVANGLLGLLSAVLGNDRGAARRRSRRRCWPEATCSSSAATTSVRPIVSARKSCGRQAGTPAR